MATKKIKEVSSETAPTVESVMVLVEEFSKKLLGLLGTKTKVLTSVDKENESILVDIDSKEEAGLLIGNRGKTISSLQIIIGLFVRQKTGFWYRVIVNVAGWREKENERLQELAKQTAERAKETGQEQFLYNLSPVQRRTIHLFLSDDKEIVTRSEGEGEGRFLIVSPK